MIPNKHTFYKITIYMNNEYRSVSYHFQSYYNALSEAVTIAKAKYPKRLTFGICWQRSAEDEWDNLDKYKDNPKFTIMDVPWNESKGLCWARHHIQKMWKGEKYTMQLDSHHRFLQDWDEILIEMMEENVRKYFE